MTNGIIVAVPQKYEKIFYNNVCILRGQFGCHLPIEIWEIGKEISDTMRQQINKFENIYFKNVEDYCDNPEHWRGFQIKVFMLKHNNFEHVILMDADLTFYMNPEIIWENKHYLKTGTYFFKDSESKKQNLQKLNAHLYKGAISLNFRAPLYFYSILTGIVFTYYQIKNYIFCWNFKAMRNMFFFSFSIILVNPASS